MTITDGTPYMQQVRMLLTEYTQALGRDLSFQKLEDELRDPAQKYAPPNGKLLVALEDGTVLGMVAYHRHSPTRCEMKRLYVRPACRGRKIGQSLIAELLRRARQAIGKWCWIPCCPCSPPSACTVRPASSPVTPITTTPCPTCCISKRNYDKSAPCHAAGGVSYTVGAS